MNTASPPIVPKSNKDVLLGMWSSDVLSTRLKYIAYAKSSVTNRQTTAWNPVPAISHTFLAQLAATATAHTNSTGRFLHGIRREFSRETFRAPLRQMSGPTASEAVDINNGQASFGVGFFPVC